MNIKVEFGEGEGKVPLKAILKGQKLTSRKSELPIR